MDVDKIAEAIEKDAGQKIEGLKESLAEMMKATPAFTHKDSMQGIAYEVARENLSAVRGQYVREQYKEEAKPQPDHKYLTQLKTEQLLVTGIINRMAGSDPALIEKLKVDYGNIYKKNKAKQENEQVTFKL